MATDQLESRMVFVLGTGRCGSTLVHEVLARHRDVGFVSNIEDNLPQLGLDGRFNQALYQRVSPTGTRKGRVRYAPSEAYQILDRQVSPILSTPFRDLLATDATPWMIKQLHGFFDPRMAAQGRPVFLHKFTGWPRAGFLKAAFPEARFIHVLRDGRAVVNSWLQMPWWAGYRGPEQWQFGPLNAEQQEEFDAAGRSFVVLAAIAWKMLVEAHESAAAALPNGDWCHIRYEDVVADPAAAFATMLDAAGLERQPQFDAALGRYTFSAGRTDAFRRDLDPANLDLLEQSLGPVLERYGYV